MSDTCKVKSANKSDSINTLSRLFASNFILRCWNRKIKTLLQMSIRIHLTCCKILYNIIQQENKGEWSLCWNIITIVRGEVKRLHTVVRARACAEEGDYPNINNTPSYTLIHPCWTRYRGDFYALIISCNHSLLDFLLLYRYLILYTFIRTYLSIFYATLHKYARWKRLQLRMVLLLSKNVHNRPGNESL